MDDTVGATGRGGVAGERPIGMRNKPGVGVVGKHPIGIPEVARCKHGVCAQIGVSAKVSTVEFSQASIHSQLPLRASKKTVLTEQWHVVATLRWLLCTCSTEVFMQAAAGHESQGGAECACAHEPQPQRAVEIITRWRTSEVKIFPPLFTSPSVFFP